MTRSLVPFAHSWYIAVNIFAMFMATNYKIYLSYIDVYLNDLSAELSALNQDIEAYRRHMLTLIWANIGTDKACSLRAPSQYLTND